MMKRRIASDYNVLSTMSSRPANDESSDTDGSVDCARAFQNRPDFVMEEEEEEAQKEKEEEEAEEDERMRSRRGSCDRDWD